MVVLVIVTTMVASTISTMVHRDRVYVSDLAQQSLLAKRNADDAHNARERLETLLRAATGSAIMGVDPAGTVTFFSAGAELMLGYNASEVVGIRSIADFIDPAQISERRRTIDAMRKALDPVYPETVAEVPWTARRKNGEQRRCVVRVRTLPTQGGTEGSDGGGSAGYVVVAIDVTEREQLAAERERLYSVQREVTQSLIEQNNRLRELTKMKDDIVATVSHELRTPITSIRGFIELLLDEVPELSEDQMRMLRTIDRNSAQLQRVAEDLLADPGGGHGLRVTFTALDLHQLADESVHGAQTAAASRGCTVSLTPGPEVPVFGDATRLHQLLGNLLSNAIKFSSRGDKVNVVVDMVDDFARVLVQDQGPGIPEADAPNSSSGSTDWRRPWRWVYPEPASVWPSRNRWLRPTRASSTSSTFPAGPPLSASFSRCATPALRHSRWPNLADGSDVPCHLTGRRPPRRSGTSCWPIPRPATQGISPAWAR